MSVIFPTEVESNELILHFHKWKKFTTFSSHLSDTSSFSLCLVSFYHTGNHGNSVS